MTVSKFISLTRKKWKKYSIIFTNHGHTLHKPLWHKNKARSFLRGPKWNEKASSGVPASYNCDRIGCEFLIFAASSSTCSNWVPESLSIPRYFYCHFIFLLFVQFISVLSNYRIFIFLCLIFVLLTHFTFILFIHPIFFFFSSHFPLTSSSHLPLITKRAILKTHKPSYGSGRTFLRF